MKHNKLFSALMLIGAAMIAACSAPPKPVNPNENPDDPQAAVYDTTAIPTTIEIPEGAITVSQAREICAGLESEQSTDTHYYVHGWIKKLHGGNADAITGSYHNAQFYMAENRMVDDKGAVIYDKDDFYAFHVKGPDNSNITDVEAIKEGDYVVLYCKLTNYNGTYETPNNSGSYVYASTNPNLKGAQPITDAVDVTVAQAIEKAKNKETVNVRLTVTVVEVKTAKDNVPSKYTNINMTVKDATGKIDCFYTNYLENKPFTSADQIPPVGSEIKVVGPLILFKDSVPEVSYGYIEEIIKVGDGGGDIITDATELSNVAEAIAKAQAGATGNFKLTAEVKEIKTDKNKVPGTYTNIDMIVKDETGEITCFRTNYIDNKPFSATEQVPPVGTKLIVVGPLTMFQTTPEFDHPYIVEILEIGQGEPPLEGDVTLKIENSIGDWTFSESKPEYYGNGGLKMNKEGMALTSPAFEAAAGATVEFEIGALNTNQNTGKNGADGDNFLIEGLNASGEAVASQTVKTSATGKYSATVESEGIVKIRLTLESFPYNGSKYCNVNLKSVTVTLATGE